MSTTVSTRGSEITTDRLLSAPLPVLLAEARAEIVEAPRHYPNFDGMVLGLHSGTSQLVLPKGRTVREREALARELVSKLLGGAR